MCDLGAICEPFLLVSVLFDSFLSPMLRYEVYFVVFSDNPRTSRVRSLDLLPWFRLFH